jgi:hypothetical protein
MTMEIAAYLFFAFLLITSAAVGMWLQKSENERLKN